MLGVVEVEPINRVRSERRARSASRWSPCSACCAAAPPSAQLNITITRGVAAAVPIGDRAVRLAGLGRRRRSTWRGVVSADLGSSGRFAPIAAERHGVAADAGVAGELPRIGACSKADYLVIGTLTEDSPDNFTAVFQLFDVTARRVGDGLSGCNAGRADLRAKRRTGSPT